VKGKELSRLLDCAVQKVQKKKVESFDFEVGFAKVELRPRKVVSDHFSKSASKVSKKGIEGLQNLIELDEERLRKGFSLKVSIVAEGLRLLYEKLKRVL
jgi:hypothetical protein